MTRTSRIGPRLYQGIAPPTGFALANLGWDVLILCALEYQPAASEFPGIEVIHAPNDDADRLPTPKEWEAAMMAGLRAARRVKEKKRVLVTCRMGINRSGLVSAIALHFLTGASPGKCIERVQKARPGSLCNEHFVRALRDNLIPTARAFERAAVYA